MSDDPEVKKEESTEVEKAQERLKGNEKKSPVIRTFSSDLADAVRKNEMSVIKVAMAEQKRREEDAMLRSPGSTKNKTYIVLTMICLLLGGGGVWYALHKKQSVAPIVIPTETKIQAIIPADATTSIEVGGTDQGKVEDLIRAAVTNISGNEGGIVDIYFTDSSGGTKKTITAGDFFTAISSAAPAPLVRSLTPEFMLGVYTKSELRHPFLILRTTDYDTAFANMFTWERKLFTDFYQPFAFKGDENTFTGKFGDLIVENKDTRILRSADGTIVLIYSFVDEHTILLTDSVESFVEVLHRLQSVKPQ